MRPARFSPLRTAPVTLLLWATAGLAQGLPEVGTAVREERQVAMAEGIYRRLNAVHELLTGDDVNGALERLDDLRGMRLSPYEEALVYQDYGFGYAYLGDYERAIEAFERCIEIDALPNEAHQGLLFSLAGLYLGEERFQEAIDTMQEWFSYAAEPVRAEAYMIVASSYGRLEQPRAALPYVQEAIARAEVPHEDWYVVELSFEYALEDYTSAARLLREMVVYWPDKASYWEWLANAYLELEDDANALAAYTVAYKKGLIGEEAKLVNLAKLNLFLELPYDAGKLLEAEIDAGRVSPTRANLELLLSAWTSAREFDRALAVIDELAPLTDDGKLYMQKALLLNEQSDWQGVVEATAQALEKGGLAETGNALILKGVAHMELGQYEQAVAVLREARETEETARRNADSWIQYVRDRQQVAQDQR